MAASRDQLSLFIVLLLFSSPQIHARKGLFFSRVIHFSSDNNVIEPKVSLPKAPAPAPAPTLGPALAPESSMVFAPSPTPVVADGGDAYGLYGRDSSRFSETQETPAVTGSNNELINEDLVGESYKTGYPKTNLYSNYQGNPTNYNDNGYYTNNYNNGQYRRNNNDNSGYPNNNKGYSYSGVYYNNAFYNNRVDSHNKYKSNGYQRQGMSDTRFVENGKWYHDVNGDNKHFDLYDQSPARENTKFGGGYYENNNKYQNEFDSMEEFERQQESQGYVP